MLLNSGLIRAVAALLVLVLLGASSAGISGADDELSGRVSEQTEASCMTTSHCALAQDCLIHCSSVTVGDFPAPVTPTFTSARAQIEPVTVRAVTADIHKPPPRSI